jgi:hypothetical protein
MNSNLLDYSLWIIGRYKDLPVVDIWAQFYHLALPNQLSVSFRSSGLNKSSVRAEKIEEILDGAHFSFFEVAGDGFVFSYGQNAGQSFDQIIIDARSFVLTPDVADALIVDTVSDSPCFIQAHFVDRNYQDMQNIFDPLQFQARGMSIEGLRMISNGLPFPLEQKIVDISRNPGRFELRQGYVVVAAAYMWFGDEFWQVTGQTPERIQAKLPANASLKFKKCWCLVANTGLFTDLKTCETQEKVKQAIFG